MTATSAHLSFLGTLGSWWHRGAHKIKVSLKALEQVSSQHHNQKPILKSLCHRQQQLLLLLKQAASLIIACMLVATC